MERKTRASGKGEDNASAKRKARGSEATENASVKHNAQGS